MRDWEDKFLIGVGIATFILVLAYFALYVYAMIADEVPWWVIVITMGGGNK